MKLELFLSILFFSSLTLGFAQQPASWDKWSWLIGEFQGEGSGKPGQGGGTFSFAFDLDKNIIVRKSHSEYPATNNKRLIVHNDLMIVYPDSTGNPSKAIYFDNEGHTINYAITYQDKSIVLTSTKMTNVPVFRLTYTLLKDGMVKAKFEMSKDGEKFMNYIEGKGKKTFFKIGS